jgi:RND family efflux transporter MFP subunit
MKPPEVDVSVPVTQEVREYEDFTGQTQAVNMIEVRARVSGYLSKVCFKEGAEVKEGDPLFEIDPRPYKADLAQAEANVVQSVAHARRLGLDLQRAERLVNKGAMSREDFDKTTGDKAEAEAAVGSAQAARDRAKLNLSFTQVAAPISGRISRRLIDPWNMVKADETPLTTLVSLDPMYAYFDVDETSAQRLRRLEREGKINWNGKMPVFLGLADEEGIREGADSFALLPPDKDSQRMGDRLSTPAGFPHEGTVNFVDNQLDPNTGTLRMRGIFPNPDRLLSPGLFARIRLPIGSPYKALLVAEQALGRDQGKKFVYVVTDKNVVEYREVKVGRLYDGLREVIGKLAPGEKVIVTGLQRVRDKATVEAKVVPMPRSGQQGEELVGKNKAATK